MSIAKNFEIIADAVYEKSKANAELEFWKGFTNNGERTNYHMSFQYTDFSGMTIPEGLCKPRTRVSSTFIYYQGEKLPLGVDCSEFSANTQTYHASQMFRYAANLTEIYDIGLPIQKTYEHCFRDCPALTKIAVIRSDENTIWNTTFANCSELIELEIEGKIGQNGFDVSGCKKLNHDSLMSIINATATIETAMTLTLGSTNLAKLTDAEKAIATERGWTLA